jgi:alkylation response protein AidB-like acyl-CoA dehydrogenase
VDVSLTGEQRELQRTVRDLAADRSTSAHRRTVIDGGTAYDADLWQLVAKDLGLPAIAVAEELGGTGGSFVEAAIVLEEAGRALMPVPLLATIAAGAAAPHDAELAAAISNGAAATVAIGEPDALRNVIDGSVAEQIVVAAPDALYVAAVADAAAVTPRPALDPLRSQADIHVDVSHARRVGGAAASSRAVDVLRVVLAVEAVGVARWCLAATVEHLKSRVQFGKPIGTFQALQHRAADLAVLLESAAATASYVAWAVADSPDELATQAPLALAVCSEASYRIAAETIQLHGGIGFTWEHDAHLYFKRATTTKLLLGDVHAQRQLAATRAAVLQAR